MASDNSVRAMMGTGGYKPAAAGEPDKKMACEKKASRRGRRYQKMNKNRGMC